MNKDQIKKRIEEIVSIPSHLREFEEKCELRSLRTRIREIEGSVSKQDIQEARKLL